MPTAMMHSDCYNTAVWYLQESGTLVLAQRWIVPSWAKCYQEWWVLHGVGGCFSDSFLLRHRPHVLDWSPATESHKSLSISFSAIQACKISACVLRWQGLPEMPRGEEDYCLSWKHPLHCECRWVGGCCFRNPPISVLSSYDKNLRFT